MNEVIKEDRIKNKIYIIRRVQVILDNELTKYMVVQMELKI